MVQHLTYPRGYLASGPLGLDLVLGVSVTILNTCNQERWSKSVCLQGPLQHAPLSMAQFLHPGPAQKSGCPQGLHTWDYPVQETQFQLQVNKGNHRGSQSDYKGQHKAKSVRATEPDKT